MYKIMLVFILFFSINGLLAKEQESGSFLDQYTLLHQKISNNYFNYLKKIDNFFCSEEDINNTSLEKIIYKSHLQLIASLKHDENKALFPSFYVRANIILPKTNKRFELTIDKQSDSKIQNQQIDSYYYNYNNFLLDEKVYIGLKYNLVKKNYYNFYAKLGARLNRPTDIYGKLGAVKYFNYHYFMLFLDSQIYKYLFNEKLIASASANFVKPIDEHFVFENNNIFTWYKHDKRSEMDHIFKLYHYIDKKNLLQYWLSYTHADEETCYFCPKAYDAYIKYQYMLNRWAYLEFSPQLLKRKENHFKLEKAMMLNFGIVF